VKAKVVSPADDGGGCLPFAIFSEPSSYSSFVRGHKIVSPVELLNLRQSELEASTGAFCSRAFAIRFTEELVELNEGACFECRVEVGLIDTLAVELELYHVPLEPGQSPPTSISLYRKVSQQVLNISNATMGVHEYFPCTFAEPFFCACDLMVHTALVKLSFWVPRRSTPSIRSKPREQRDKSFSLANIFAPLDESQYSNTPMSSSEFLLYCAAAAKDPSVGSEEDVALADLADTTFSKFEAMLAMSILEARQSLKWLLDEVMTDATKSSLLVSSPATEPKLRSTDVYSLRATNSFPSQAVSGEGFKTSSFRMSDAFKTRGDPMFDVASRGAYGPGTSFPGSGEPASDEPMLDELDRSSHNLRGMEQLTLPSLEHLQAMLSLEYQHRRSLTNNIDHITPKAIVDYVGRELGKMGRHCFELFSNFAALVPRCGSSLVRVMHERWLHRSQRAWAQQVMAQTVRFTTLLQPFSESVHGRMVAEMRQQFSNKKVLQMPVYDVRTFNSGHFLTLPLAHLQRYSVGDENSHVQAIKNMEYKEAMDMQLDAAFLESQAKLSDEGFHDPFAGIVDFFRSLTPARDNKSRTNSSPARASSAVSMRPDMRPSAVAAAKEKRSTAPQRLRPGQDDSQNLQRRMETAYARASARQALQRELMISPEDVLMLEEFQKRVAAIDAKHIDNEDALSYHPKQGLNSPQFNHGEIGSFDRDIVPPLPIAALMNPGERQISSPERRPNSRGRLKTNMMRNVSSIESTPFKLESMKRMQDGLSPLKRPSSSVGPKVRSGSSIPQRMDMKMRGNSTPPARTLQSQSTHNAQKHLETPNNSVPFPSPIVEEKKQLIHLDSTNSLTNSMSNSMSAEGNASLWQSLGEPEAGTDAMLPRVVARRPDSKPRASYTEPNTRERRPDSRPPSRGRDSVASSRASSSSPRRPSNADELVIPGSLNIPRSLSRSEWVSSIRSEFNHVADEPIIPLPNPMSTSFNGQLNIRRSSFNELNNRERRPDSRPPSRGRDNGRDTSSQAASFSSRGMSRNASEQSFPLYDASHQRNLSRSEWVATIRSELEKASAEGSFSMKAYDAENENIETTSLSDIMVNGEDTSLMDSMEERASTCSAGPGVDVLAWGSNDRPFKSFNATSAGFETMRSQSAIPTRRPQSRGRPKLDLRPSSAPKPRPTGGAGSAKWVSMEYFKDQVIPPPETHIDEPSPTGDDHIIVLHHGLGGSSNDLRIFKNYVQVIFPEAKVMVSSANHFSKEDGIEIMGERLADEVRKFILEKMPEMGHPTRPRGRLSFIGYSLGSLVIRAALVSRSLKLFLPRLHALISLSSPHLGCPYSASGLIKTGMWALRKFMKVKVLEELELKDSPNPTDTYLYRLSVLPGLRYFKHLVLVSAHQDKYVPSYSARIQICSQAGSDFVQGPAVIDMAANLMSEVDPSRVIHVDLDNVFETVNMNTMIGRAAHLSYLTSPQVINLLLFTFCDVLK